MIKLSRTTVYFVQINSKSEELFGEGVKSQAWRWGQRRRLFHYLPPRIYERNLIMQLLTNQLEICFVCDIYALSQNPLDKKKTFWCPISLIWTIIINDVNPILTINSFKSCCLRAMPVVQWSRRPTSNLVIQGSILALPEDFHNCKYFSKISLLKVLY